MVQARPSSDLTRFHIDVYAREVWSRRWTRMAGPAVLGLFVALSGSPAYLLSFLAPQIALAGAQLWLAQQWSAGGAKQPTRRFTATMAALRTAATAQACWCGLDLRFTHHMAAAGSLVVLITLFLAALEPQPGRRSYFASLAPPLATLLFIGFFRPLTDVSVGVGILLLLVLVLPAAFRLRRALLDGLQLQAEASAKNAELARALAISDLAEEVAGLGRWRLSVPTGVVEWSRATFAMHGRDPAEGVPLLEQAIAYYHPDDIEQVQAAVATALASDAVLAFEHRLLRADGSIRYVQTRSQRIEAADGDISLIGVLQDVTDQMLAARAIAESEERFRSLAENASDVILRTGLDGRITYISPAVETVTGYMPAELIGRTALDLMLPEDAGPVTARLTEAVKARETAPWTVQYRVRRKDGGIRWVQARPRLVSDPETGRLVGIADVVRDVTEARRTAEELEAREAAFRLLAETATDMISRTSLRDEILFISPACERMLGYRPEELIGCRVAQHVHPEDYAALQDKLAAYVAEGPGAAPITTQYRARRKDGGWIWLEGRPRVVFDPATGRAIEMQDAVRDISQRREMELELVAAREAAEAAARAKADFLANMSHELRTPLNSIVGFSGLIAAAPELEAETRRRAQLVAGASRSLVEIVNDILDFSKLESEGVSLASEPVVLDQLVRAAVELVREGAEEKGLRLVLRSCGPEAPVMLDPTRVRQVVLNLIGNAVKFTERGTVTVTLGREPDGLTKVAVGDTGVGIPGEQLQRVFDRFAQADGSTSRRFGGTGLGLTICKTLVEAMGGAIGARSIEGVGSTFWFTLDPPLAAQLPPSLPSRPAERGGLAGVNALLADDNEINRELFRALMEPTGLQISTVVNGAQAVEAVRDGVFDIVFMDMQMPVMDGLEASRAIRASGLTALPIVALTANAMHAQVELCRAAGMNDHLAKPYTVAEVRQVIGRLLDPRPAPAAANPTLDALRGSLGPAALDLFLGRLVGQLEGIERLLAEADEATAARARSLGGLAGTLGFADVAAACAELEAALGDAESSGRVGALKSAVRSAADAALQTLRSLRAAA